MNATIPPQKSNTSADAITLPIVAFEDGCGGITSYIQPRSHVEGETQAAASLVRQGFVDNIRELINEDAFEEQTPGLAPEPETILTVTVTPERVERIVARAEFFSGEGVERFERSAISTVVD